MKYKIFIPKSIYNPTPKILEVTGYPVEFNPPYNFFAAKRDSRSWAVYEETSGGRIAGFGKTEKEAIFLAREKLEIVSIENMKLAVETGIKEREEFESSLDK